MDRTGLPGASGIDQRSPGIFDRAFSAIEQRRARSFASLRVSVRERDRLLSAAVVGPNDGYSYQTHRQSLPRSFVPDQFRGAGAPAALRRRRRFFGPLRPTHRRLFRAPAACLERGAAAPHGAAFSGPDVEENRSIGRVVGKGAHARLQDYLWRNDFRLQPALPNAVRAYFAAGSALVRGQGERGGRLLPSDLVHDGIPPSFRHAAGRRENLESRFDQQRNLSFS